jgi:malonyl-CoA O-methyltransferase
MNASMTPLRPTCFLRNNFNRAASTYNHCALLSQEIGQRLDECLAFMRINPQRILDLGAATGYTSGLLAKRYPVAQVIAVDFAQQMLLHIPKSSASKTHLQRICADAEKLPFMAHSFDLIVSNLMLPWCFDLPPIFQQVSQALKPGGLFLFSTFGPDTLYELGVSWAAVDDMPHVHPCYDLHDMGDIMLKAGLVDPVINQEILTLSYKSPQALFADLKGTGSQNMLHQQRPGLTGKTRWQQFLRNYQEYRDDNGRIPAKFEIVYGHAWRSTRTVATGNTVLVPIHQIKGLNQE